MNKADLIIHPVRLRMLRELGSEALTTQEISDRLGDVPTSSVYRHFKLLLDGGVVEVADTRLVKGIQEKTYRISQPPILGPAHVANWTADDHVSYFTTYVLALLHDYARYVSQAAAQDGVIDMVTDRAGFREVNLFATRQELDVAVGAMSAAVMPLIKNEDGNGRRKYKLATVLHPVIEENQNG